MSPISVESVSLPPLDLPAPPAAPPAGERSGASSFQDYLQQAGRSSEPRPGADARDDHRADAASKHPGQEEETRSAAADPKRTEPAKTDKEPQAEGAKDHADDKADPKATAPTGEQKHDAGNDGEKKKQGKDDAAAIAAAAAAGQKETQPIPGDEVTISAEAQTSVAEATKKATKAGKPAGAPKVVGRSQDQEPTPDAGPKALVVDTAPAVAGAVAAKTQVAADSRQDHAAAAHDPTTQALGAAVSTTVAEVPAAVVVETEKKGDSRHNDGTPKTALAAALKENHLTTADDPLNTIATQVVEAAAAAVAQTTGELASGSASESSTTSSADDKPKTERHAGVAAVDRVPGGADVPRTAAAQAATEREGGASISQADRARLVQRVARALHTAHDRGGDLQVRLSPPELGSLRLHVKLSDGALSARLEAETPQAKQLLTDNLPMLRERLAEQNIRIERFDVDLFQSGGGGPSNLPDRRNDAPHDGAPKRAAAGVARGDGELEIASPVAPSGRPSDGRLDIFI